MEILDVVRRWQAGESEKHRREIELEQHILSAKQSQTMLLGRGLLVVLGGVLAIAAGLFYAGRDPTAMELVKLIGVGVLGAFGGYGLGKTTGRGDDDFLDTGGSQHLLARTL